MPTIISIANAKGGVAKTTATMNIGAGLTKVGKKVLLVDLDQQSNLSDYLGFDFAAVPTISEVIYSNVAGHPINYDNVIRTSAEGMDYIPSSKMLATIISILGNDSNSQTVLQRIFKDPYFQVYDYIIIDCRPSLDLLVTNALAASNELIIPIEAEKFALDGVQTILDNYNSVVNTQNANLKLGGILIAKSATGTNIAKQVEDYLRSEYGNLVYSTVIPRLTAEAAISTCEQRSFVHTGNRLGTKYMEVVEEILHGSKSTN